jgi:hypothetical protein
LRQEIFGDQVLLLGRHQLRAVDGQEWLALAHLFVCCVGIYLLNPAGEADLHVGKPRFVRLDVSDGADLVADRNRSINSRSGIAWLREADITSPRR